MITRWMGLSVLAAALAAAPAKAEDGRATATGGAPAQPGASAEVSVASVDAAAIEDTVIEPVRVRATPVTGELAQRPSLADPPLFQDDEQPQAVVLGGPGYSMDWNTVDGGGITFATGGAFELAGTIGQPDVGTLSGGAFVLSGGFLGRVRIELECLGDANGDLVVDFADLTSVLTNWGDFGAAGDADNDWFVDFTDITVILTNWSRTCP